jgi:hypothetical protein
MCLTGTEAERAAEGAAVAPASTGILAAAIMCPVVHAFHTLQRCEARYKISQIQTLFIRLVFYLEHDVSETGFCLRLLSCYPSS